MKLKRLLSIALSVATTLALLTGCNNSAVNTAVYKFNKKISTKTIESQVIASNSNYELLWDDNAKCVMLKCISNNKIFSTTPYEYLVSGGTSSSVNSPLYITIMNSSSMQMETVRGYTEVIENGRMVCELIDDGIRVTYLFDNYEISVPLEYTLREDSMAITVDTEKIAEGEEYKIVSVSVAPYLCSVTNDADGAYLFIPSGAGALMYATNGSGNTREYVGEVYGKDGSRLLPEEPVNEESIRMPVYGVNQGTEGLFAILEKGAESAVIEAESGNNRTGYTNAFATFYIRGYDTFASDLWRLSYKDLSQASEAHSVSEMTIGFYPLLDENSDYNGMAKLYRNYLLKNNSLIKSEVEDSIYSLNLLGGILTTSAKGGIPHKTTKAMTTFAQANEILNELCSDIQTVPTVQLSGYGDSGINPGKVAGGFDFSSKLGKDSMRKELENFCGANGINLFTDFNIVQYSKSGEGYSYLNDAAKSASLHVVEQSPINVALRDYNEDYSYRLLKRSKLFDAIENVIKTAEKEDVSGISLSTLGSIAYSDFSDLAYVTKGSMAQDVKSMLKDVKDSGKTVSVSDANDYAAGIADVVFNIPTENGGYDALDETIPFYQMVFKGYKPLYVTAVNLAADSKQQIMLAAVGGSGLSFTLIHDFDVSFAESGVAKLYSAVYGDNKALIKESVENYNSVFEKLRDVTIDSYTLPQNGISKTVFSNGVTLYANHTSKSIDCSVGSLEPYEFIVQ